MTERDNERRIVAIAHELDVMEELRKSIPACDQIVGDLRAWLGDDGVEFFDEMHKQGVALSLAKSKSQVRNYLRTLPACKGWTDHELDDRWGALVRMALQD